MLVLVLVAERMVAGTADGTTWADDANAAAALACMNTRRQNDNLIAKEQVKFMCLELAKELHFLWSTNGMVLNLSGKIGVARRRRKSSCPPL